VDWHHNPSINLFYTFNLLVMTTPTDLFIEKICGDCLQSIVNGDNDRDEKELAEMHKTLTNWRKQQLYAPAGLTQNTEPFFDWHRCILCGQLPGNRYEYYFKDNKNDLEPD
jgi:hypothetical protein